MLQGEELIIAQSKITRMTALLQESRKILEAHWVATGIRKRPRLLYEIDAILKEQS